jgi:hypothetical protein
MIPRLLCEFLSFYLRSSLMVAAAQTKKNKQTHASSPPRRALSSVTIIWHVAKEQRADWQHNPDCASAAAKILQTRTLQSSALCCAAHSVAER